MTAFNLNNQNILTFRRIDIPDVISYSVKVKERLPNGNLAEYVLAVIPNPNVPNPVHHIQELDYIKKQIYNLPSDIYYTYDNPVTVSINGVALTTLQYTYDEILFMLTISAVIIKETDLIEVGYYKDEIQYVHQTSNKCEYCITPNVNNTYKIGNHNIVL